MPLDHNVQWTPPCIGEIKERYSLKCSTCLNAALCSLIVMADWIRIYMEGEGIEGENKSKDDRV